MDLWHLVQEVFFISMTFDSLDEKDKKRGV
jgi:hypothetical protein